MIRTLFGYAVLAVIGFIALQLVFGLLGFAVSLLMKLVVLAAIGRLSGRRRRGGLWWTARA